MFIVSCIGTLYHSEEVRNTYGIVMKEPAINASACCDGRVRFNPRRRDPRYVDVSERTSVPATHDSISSCATYKYHGLFWSLGTLDEY